MLATATKLRNVIKTTKQGSQSEQLQTFVTF